MKVSIITVVYNAEKTISCCIESVLNQSYSNIEYIIIDGNSKDKTVEIIKRYGSKITTFLSEKDKGIYDAMNKGIARATGDIVGILNADDFYTDSSIISDVVNQFENTNAEALYADLVFVKPNDTEQVTRYWQSGNYDKSKFLYGWMPPHPTFFVKRESYKQLGDFRLDMGSAADYELMLRFCYKHNLNVTYLPKIVIKMRMGGESTKSLSNRLKAHQNDARAWQINGLKPLFFTNFLKPIRKLIQLIDRPKITVK